MWPREDQEGVVTPPEETQIIRLAYDECRVFTTSKEFGDFPEPLPGGLTHFDRLTSRKMSGWLMRFSAIQASRVADLEELLADSQSDMDSVHAHSWIQALNNTAFEARLLKGALPFKLEKSRKLVERNQRKPTD